MTRREFLKKIGAGIMGFGMLCLFPLEEIKAATVTDNLVDGGLHVGDLPPSNRSLLWMDTSESPAIPKYWTGVDWAVCNSKMLDSHDSSFYASRDDIEDTMDVISALQTRLANEVTSREESVERLETGIQNEETSRIEAVNSVSSRLDNNVQALSERIYNESTARATAVTNISSRIGNSVGSSTVPVYVNASGNMAAVSGLDASGLSVFKIPVNPSSTTNMNLWITT